MRTVPTIFFAPELVRSRPIKCGAKIFARAVSANGDCYVVTDRLKRFRAPVSQHGGCGSHVRQPSGALERHLLQSGAARHSRTESKRPQAYDLRPSGSPNQLEPLDGGRMRRIVDVVNYWRRPAIQDVGRSHVTCGSTSATALGSSPL